MASCGGAGAGCAIGHRLRSTIEKPCKRGEFSTLMRDDAPVLKKAGGREHAQSGNRTPRRICRMFTAKSDGTREPGDLRRDRPWLWPFRVLTGRSPGIPAVVLVKALRPRRHGRSRVHAGASGGLLRDRCGMRRFYCGRADSSPSTSEANRRAARAVTSHRCRHRQHQKKAAAASSEVGAS